MEFEGLNDGEKSLLRVWNKSSSLGRGRERGPEREIGCYIFIVLGYLFQSGFIAPGIFMTNQSTVFPDNCDM